MSKLWENLDKFYPENKILEYIDKNEINCRYKLSFISEENISNENLKDNYKFHKKPFGMTQEFPTEVEFAKCERLTSEDCDQETIKFDFDITDKSNIIFSYFLIKTLFVFKKINSFIYLL